MGNNTQVIDVITRFQGDISNINGAIKEIEGQLGNLKLAPNVEKNFLNLVSRLQNEMSSFESKAKAGITDMADSRALEKSGKNILNLYNQIVNEIKVMGKTSGSNFEKMFPDSVTKEIKEATSAIKKYQEGHKNSKDRIEESNKKIKEQLEISEELSKKREKLSKQKILSEQDQKRLSSAKAARTKAYNDRDALQARIDNAASEGTVKLTKNGTLDKRSKGNQGFIQELDEVNKRIQEAEVRVEKLKKEFSGQIPESQFKKEMAENAKAISENEATLKTLQDNISKLSTQDIGSFDELVNKLKELTGLDYDGLENTDENIDKIAQSINELETDVIKKLLNYIGEMKTTADSAGPAVEDLGHKVSEAAGEMKELTDRQKELDQLKNSFLSFFSIGNTINLFRNAIRSAVETVKDLDATMTEAATVTDFSVSDMWEQLPKYTAEAQKLGSTINDVYGATTIYYQQGLKSNEAMELGVETMKMARIAGMDVKDATDSMTAALRGFNMELSETSGQRVNDVYSKLAAITAANTEEISVAMGKTASIASSANMEFETTAALLAQIIETTREAPETAGTAMKTIIARFTEVKELFSQGQLTGTDEEGEAIDINKIDKALKTVGISLRGFLQGTEGIDSIFLKLAEKWDSLDIATQRYIATTAAGSRQQSRFLAMMSNYDRTMELVQAANNSAGASQEQFNKTLDSLDAKLNKLKNAWDSFTMSLANNEIIKFGVDAITTMVNGINQLIDGLSGGNGLIKSVLSLGTAFLGIRGASTIFHTALAKIPTGSILSFLKPKEEQKTSFGIKDGITKGINNFRGIGDSDTTIKKMSDISIAASAAGVGLKALTANLKENGAIGEKTAEVFDSIGNSLMGLPLILTGVRTAAKALHSTLNGFKLGMIAVGITGLIAAFKILDAVIETSEEKVERLTEELDQSKQTAQDTKQAYDNLLSSFSSYDEAQKTLEELTKGTLEWKQALVETNQQVLELLSTYPELAQYISRGEDGQLVISDEGRDALVENQLKGVTNTANAAIGAEIQLNEAKLALDQEKISQGFGMGSISNEAINKIVELSNKNIEAFANKKSASEVSELDSDQWDALAKEFGYESGELAKANYEASGALYEAELVKLANEIGVGVGELFNKGQDIVNFAGQQLTTELTNSSLMQSMINSQVEDGEYVNTLVSGISENFGQSYTEATEERTKENKNKSDDELDQLYKELGGNVEDISKYTLDEKAALIARIQVSNDYVNKVNQINSKLEGMNPDDAKVAAAFASGNLDDLSKAEIEGYAEGGIDKVEFGEIATSMGIKPEDLLSLMGFENIDEALSFLTEKFNGAAEEFGKIGSGDTLADAYARMYSENQDFGTSKNIQEAFYNANNYGGDAVNAIASIFTNLEGESKQFAFDMAKTFDFRKPKDIENFLNSILDIDSTINPSLIQTWREELTKAFDAIESFDANNIKNELKTALDLEDKIREKDGVGFSQEEYEEVIAAGAQEENFVWTGQEWTYIGGSMDTLADEIRANTEAQINNTLALLNKQIESGEQFEKVENSGMVAYNETSREEFLAGEATDIAAIREFYSNSGIETTTDSTGATVNLSNLSDEKLLEVYKYQSSNYANLDANVAARNEKEALLNSYQDSEALTNQTPEMQEAAVLNEASRWGLDTNEIATYADHLQKVNTNLNEVDAAQVALNNTLMNTGLGEVIDSYDEWVPLIDKSTGLIKTGSNEDVAAFNKLKESTNKMLNTSKNLSESFWDNADNMKLVKAAAEGDTKALGKLQKIAAQDYLMQLAVEADTEEAQNAILTLSDFISDYEFPELAPGIDLSSVDSGTSEFLQRCNELIAASGMTSEQVSNAFKSMGYDVEFDENPQTITENMAVPVTTYSVSGSMADGSFKMTPNVEIKDFPYTRQVSAPTIKTLTSTGSMGGGVSTNNATKAKSNAKPSTGGGGGATKKETWDNPYDELYNLTEKVNEALRTREKLERNYERLLKNHKATSDQLLANSLKEVATLRQEIAYQKQLQSGRLSQIQRLASETHKDEEGNEKTFAEWGVTRYASYDATTGLISIDWENIDKITDTEIGGAVEAYVSKLEELSEQYEETQKTIEEMQDTIDDIKERGLEEYLEFEDKIYQALIDQQQKVIDNYQQLSDTLAESDEEILNSLQESIDLERQIRDNTKTEEDIAEKEMRLAYLRRDTSGANDLEIKNLEEELRDMREGYGDTIVDQEIQKLSKASEEASKQRQKQIAIMEAQLDYETKNGKYWGQVYNLLDSSINPDGSLKNNSSLVQLLQEAETFRGLSQFGKIQWMRDLVKQFNTSEEGRKKWEIEEAMETGKAFATAQGKLTYDPNSRRWKDTKGGSYEDVQYDPNKKAYVATGYKAPASSKPAQNTSTQTSTPQPSSYYSAPNAADMARRGLDRNSFVDSLKAIGISTSMATRRQIAAANGISNYTGTGDQNGMLRRLLFAGQLKKFAIGGLADFTGPAWLDGSKSKPELVLNAEDTRNFIQLKNVLSDLVKGNNFNNEKGGDNYFEIHINVDELANDYDVEKLTEKIKEEINADARYRNVNAINLLR